MFIWFFSDNFLQFPNPFPPFPCTKCTEKKIETRDTSRNSNTMERFGALNYSAATLDSEMK